MKVAIHWFRRDLRLTDNTALLAAARQSDQVIPAYILSDWKGEHRWTGPHRQRLLCESLSALSEAISAKGGRLIIRQGDAVHELQRLAHEFKATAIHFNRDPDPFGRKVEEKLARFGREAGIEIFSHQDVCLHERDEVQTKTGGPFRVFTPFSKAWGKLEKPAAHGLIRKLTTPSQGHSLPLPTLETWGLSDSESGTPGGEAAARQRMKRFLRDGIKGYDTTRNLLTGDGTSRLSQDLRYGLISIRELHAECRAREAHGRVGVGAYIRELVWREFCMGLLWHYPEVLEVDFNKVYRRMKWPGATADFRRWCAGETGFPIVDAAMRQLAQTGYLPNRARLIVAMFLTKDLQVDWREGEAHFMRHLIDGEIANNNTNWQWCAGTGADAAPYFRIHNPWTQAVRYDPDAAYIREWLPELKDVPTKKLLNPPEHGERIARGYPAPVVDHAEAREKTLELFHRARRA